MGGECVGLDGGASTLTSSNNRRKQYNRKQHNLSASGDSADGELSDDETGAHGSNGDRTPSSSTKKLHKKSPKKYPFSSSKSRKAKDKGEKLTRRNLRLRKRELSHSVSSKEQIKQKLPSSEKVKDAS